MAKFDKDAQGRAINQELKMDKQLVLLGNKSVVHCHTLFKMKT